MDCFRILPLLLVAAVAQAEGVGMQYRSPSGLFSLEVPAHFSCSGRDLEVRCSADDGSILTVMASNVPVGANLGLIALAHKDVYRSKPNFRLYKEEKLLVDQAPAMVQAFSYNLLANVQLEIFSHHLMVLRANKLITVEFSCSARMKESYNYYLGRIAASLKVVRFSKSGLPELVAPKKALPPPGNDVLEKLIKSFDGDAKQQKL